VRRGPCGGVRGCHINEPTFSKIVYYEEPPEDTWASSRPAKMYVAAPSGKRACILLLIVFFSRQNSQAAEMISTDATSPCKQNHIG
jgi:hypothetical protein